jgi:hypothetical protein
MEKRKWCYVNPPHRYDILCDKCGGRNIEWSEYEHKIWCYDCKIDTDGTEGVFGGPIPIKASYLLGVTFDRINLETKEIEKLNLDKIETDNICVWDPPEIWKKNLSEKNLTIRMLKGETYPDTYGDCTRAHGSLYFELDPNDNSIIFRKHNGEDV